MIHLPLDHRALPLGRVAAAKLHQLQRRQDRRQRVAKLVTEHREELVLRAVRGLGGFAECVDLIAREHLFGHVRGNHENPFDLARRRFEMANTRS